jgi:HlyD family secretion protein
LDDARRNLEVAQSQVRAAELQVATAQPGGSDRAVAETARREAQAAIAVAEAKRLSTIIRAPADGTLIARRVEPGDVAQSGRELLVLAPSGETQIIVNIDEKHLGKLAPGQKALASADAFPGETFEAELFYVNPGIDPVRGSVQVKLRVADPPSYLRQDMSVSVDIEVARRNDVVVVPADALRDAATSQPWVMVVRNGATARQPVTLGMRGDSAAEVIAGLSPGDVVVPAGDARVAARAHVRPMTSGNPGKR